MASSTTRVDVRDGPIPAPAYAQARGHCVRDPDTKAVKFQCGEPGCRSRVQNTAQAIKAHLKSKHQQNSLYLQGQEAFVVPQTCAEHGCDFLIQSQNTMVAHHRQVHGHRGSQQEIFEKYKLDEAHGRTPTPTRAHTQAQVHMSNVAAPVALSGYAPGLLTASTGPAPLGYSASSPMASAAGAHPFAGFAASTPVAGVDGAQIAPGASPSGITTAHPATGELSLQGNAIFPLANNYSLQTAVSPDNHIYAFDFLDLPFFDHLNTTFAFDSINNFGSPQSHNEDLFFDQDYYPIDLYTDSTMGNLNPDHGSQAGESSGRGHARPVGYSKNQAGSGMPTSPQNSQPDQAILHPSLRSRQNVMSRLQAITHGNNQRQAGSAGMQIAVQQQPIQQSARQSQPLGNSHTARRDSREHTQYQHRAQTQPQSRVAHHRPESVNLPATLPGGPHPTLPGPAYGSMTQQYYVQVPIPAWQLIDGIGRLYPNESQGNWSEYPDPLVVGNQPTTDPNYGISPSDYLATMDYWRRWFTAGGQALVVPGVDGFANVPFRRQAAGQDSGQQGQDGAGSQAGQSQVADPVSANNEELGWVPGEGCTYEDFVEHEPVLGIHPRVPWPRPQ